MAGDDVIAHYERYLGQIESRWCPDGRAGFRVVRARGTGDGWSTYATLGIGEAVLYNRKRDAHIRQEFTLMAYDTVDVETALSRLAQVAELCQQRRRALLRGEVIGPGGPLSRGVSTSNLYVSAPVYQPDAFAVLNDTPRNPIVFCWLVPITEAEAQFIDRVGWSAFEDLLVQANPDLVDWSRPSIV